MAWISSVIDAITAWALASAASPWVYPVMFLLTLTDAFLVIVPSETVLVALGALSAATGTLNLALLIPVTALAAMLGDSLTFALGRCLGLDRFAWMRRPAISRTLRWAQHSLDRRAAVVLLTARFIPFGRIAVNLAAGATGFSYRRFLALTSIAGVAWAGYNLAIGALFGAWLGSSPLLAVFVSVVVAVLLGIAVDRISARMSASSALKVDARLEAL